MSRTLAVIAGAIILFAAALAASFAFIGNGSSGSSPDGGAAPVHTMADGTGMSGSRGGMTTAATTTDAAPDAHPMSDGSMMDDSVNMDGAGGR